MRWRNLKNFEVGSTRFSSSAATPWRSVPRNIAGRIAALAANA
jgi:hypothetical protein